MTLRMPLNVSSGLPGKRASSQYDSFSGKMVMKRTCIGDTGEDCSTH